MLQMQFSIFQGIDEKEWQEMQSLSCTRRAAFEKNDIIELKTGEKINGKKIIILI